jgi:nucleotide-binding universal stress UspA family protein
MTTPWTPTPVLAATDLGKGSLPALQYARLFADAFDAKLTVIYSDPIVYPIDTIGPSQAMFIMPPPEHDERLRKDLVDHVAPVMTGRQYEIELTMGQPIAAILETAAERSADLIVTGSHLREGWKRLLLGSVSDGVQHESLCPVLTVSGGHDDDRRITNILCPVNFTDVARDALAAAAQLAKAFRARLFVVHVIEADEVKSAPDDEAKIRQWIGPELQASCSYREIVVRGGPAERVLDCAEDIGANLLVIGAQHNASVIGATTERLIHVASCPVLVIPRIPAGKEVTYENLRERTDRVDRGRDARGARTL